jgi:hypothetical protein
MHFAYAPYGLSTKVLTLHKGNGMIEEPGDDPYIDCVAVGNSLKVTFEIVQGYSYFLVLPKDKSVSDTRPGEVIHLEDEQVAELRDLLTELLDHLEKR